MAEENNYPPPLRADAQRAQVYNDGLAVYLYDLSFRDELKKENAWEKVNEAFDEEEPEKELKKFLSSKRLVAYELQQDDSVVLDASVGAPLTKDELKSRKGVKWLKPQTSIIRLPTGKLRVESANSCQIGAEDTNEEGVTLSFPPGEYLLTLHRIDWDSMKESERNEPKIVGESVTLTPVAETKVPKSFSAVLRFPIAKPNMKWVGAYTVEGTTFKGQVCFPEHWEFISLNLDRAAFQKMGMGPGTVFDIEALDRKFTAVYLGEGIQYGIAALAGYKHIFGNERTTAELVKEPELCLATFFMQEAIKQEIFCCMRINAKTAIPEGKTGKWMKVTVTPRPEKLNFPDLADFGKWKQDGKSIHGTVLLKSTRYMSLNLDSKALEAAGIVPGETISIRAGNKELKALFVATPAEMAKAIQGRSELQGEARDEYMKLRVKIYDAKDAELEEIHAKLRQMFTKEPPLIACLDKYWLDKNQTIFLVTPMAADKESIKLTFPLEFPVKAGDGAVVSKL